jgi:hypothetical protein
MRSTARDRWGRLVAGFRGWVAADMAAAPLARFRMAFAVVWLVYDLVDVAVGGTSAIHDWVTTAQRAPPQLQVIQVGLVGAEALLLLGVEVTAVALLAASLRALEWYQWLRLNDFQYYVVTAVILATTRSGGGLLRRDLGRARVPSWPRDVLLIQAGWMYVATALMKISPAWLEGGQLIVRHHYLWAARGWPYPAFYRRWADSLAFNAALAWCAVTCELTLGVVLLFFRRRARTLAVLLAVAVHGFAAVFMNVFFFGASLVAQVALLVPRDQDEGA